MIEVERHLACGHCLDLMLYNTESGNIWCRGCKRSRSIKSDATYPVGCLWVTDGTVVAAGESL